MSGALQPYVISVAVDARFDSAPLLTLASVMHRRGVTIVDAEMSSPEGGRQLMTATFQATPERSRTVLETFRGRIGVLDAVLFDRSETIQRTH